MELTILQFVQFGTPALILGMIVFLTIINQKVNTIRDTIQEIKTGKVEQDVYCGKVEEIERRLNIVEQYMLN